MSVVVNYRGKGKGDIWGDGVGRGSLEKGYMGRFL